MAEQVFVHIGLPKTATTYLQTIMWSSRDQMRAEGLLLPGAERRDHLWSSRLVRELAPPPQFLDRATTAWDRVREEVEAWPERAVVSHEFFAAASGEQAARMVAELAPAEVHVVVTAREPLGLFTAGWQESLKNRETAPMPEFSEEESDNPAAIWNWRTLDLGAVLERWGPVVPPERVHVLPVDATGPREAIWYSYAGLLGLDAAAYDLSVSFPNASMGVVEAETLRRVNEHLVVRDEMDSAYDRGVFLRTFVADERLVPRGGEKYWPTPDQVEECRRRGVRAQALVQQQGYDVVGSDAALLVPDTLPERRRADSVSDAEVADVATDLVGVLLCDVRDLRIKVRQAKRATKRQVKRAEEAEADAAAAHARVAELYAKRAWWRKVGRRLQDAAERRRA